MFSMQHSHEGKTGLTWMNGIALTTIPIRLDKAGHPGGASS